MNDRHVTNERMNDLVERGTPLSGEEATHLEQCSRCAAALEHRAAAGAVLPFRVGADDAAIDRIAAASFGHLAGTRPGLFASLFTLPRVALGAAAALLLLIAAYFGMATTPADEGAKFAGNDPAPKTAPALDATPRAFTDGTTIIHGRAHLAVRKGATLSAEGAERITLARGTVEIAIEKGDDFHIRADGHYLVRVLGTRFTLDAGDARLSVTVTEGLVEVIDGRSGRSTALSSGMAQVFGDEPHALAATPTTVKAAKTAEPEAETAEKEEAASFLKQGRAALRNGDDTGAMGWFEKELSEGDEKDKALFEIVRLHEKGGRFGDILATLKTHGDIVDGDSVYREELLIKACKAEVREHIGTLPSCRKYLRTFPDGYKKDEIRGILENGDAQ